MIYNGINVTAQDFVAVEENENDSKQGCDACWFKIGEGSGRCCHKNEEMRRLLTDTEKHLDSDCYMDNVHYKLNNNKND